METPLAMEPLPVPEPEPRLRNRSWLRFRRHPLGLIGLGGILLLVAFSFLGPLVYHAAPDQTHLLHMLAPPDARFPLGTDGLGRDELARLMWGGQSSLEVGFAAAFVAILLGTVYGMTAGLAGGAVDVVMMRVVDVALSIPALFILLFLDSVFRPSVPLMVLILGAVSWTPVSRLVRAEVLRLKQLPYVEAEYAMGAGIGRIMWHALLPNLLAVVLVAATFSVADAILTVAVLSFLGLGLPPPAPNWGGMLSTAMSYMYQNSWWLIYPPGVAILLAELSVNFIGDALRTAFDTRIRI